MRLKNKADKKIYLVSTESEGIENSFRIYAQPKEPDASAFVMHYRTLAEFCDEWEDVD